MRISDWSSDVCSSDLEALVAQHHPLFGSHTAAEVAGAADRGAPKAHPLTEVGVVVHDHALEVGVGPHPHVGAEHRVGAQPHPGLDAAVLAEDGGALDDRLGVDLSALADVHAVAHLAAGNGIGSAS